MKKFSAEQNIEYWNEYAKKSKDSLHGASDGKHLVEIENQFIISELKSRKTMSMLDLGCGNGQRTLLFSKYVTKRVCGIDYSEQMIKQAKKLLLKQNRAVKKKLSFQCSNAQNLDFDEKFDTIVSCRCIINQPTTDRQIRLFKSLHQLLNSGGSLIIAEISKKGMERLNRLRKKHGLKPIKERWHNLHINENIVFPKIQKLFSIKSIKRAGIFYYLSRVLHPSLVYPSEPKQDAGINDIALHSELILQKEVKKFDEFFERIGGHLLVHFKKK